MSKLGLGSGLNLDTKVFKIDNLSIHTIAKERQRERYCCVCYGEKVCEYYVEFSIRRKVGYNEFPVYTIEDICSDTCCDIVRLRFNLV